MAVATSLDIDIRWAGEGVEEKGYDKATGTCIVAVDPRYFRPTEVDALLGDSSKARKELGFEPRPAVRAVEDAVSWFR